MRPTVDEQLNGTCRILETVVAPCVADSYARTILENLIANLRMVTAALPMVTGFLRADNAATLGQLMGLREALPDELAERIDQAAAADEPDVADGAALDERNALLRGLLAEAVSCPALTPENRRSLTVYMIERASRAPMRYVSTVASATPAISKG